MDTLQLKKIGSGYGINGVKPLYLRIYNASGYIEEVNKDKYLVFDDTYENKKLKYDFKLMFSMELWIKLKKNRWWLASIFKRLHED